MADTKEAFDERIAALRTELADALQRAARAEKERDEAVAARVEANNQWRLDYNEVVGNTELLQEQTIAALAPFAALATRWSDRLPDDERIGGATVMRDGGALNLHFEHEYTMGDLRRAAALHARLSPDAGESGE